jgi:hypothetical protein
MESAAADHLTKDVSISRLPMPSSFFMESPLGDHKHELMKPGIQKSYQ